VFEFFTGFLLREWNSEIAASKRGAGSASMRFSSLLLESKEQRAPVVDKRSPLPVYVAPDGRARIVGEPGSGAAGVVSENPLKVASSAGDEGGRVFLWTGRMEAFAEEQQSAAPALARHCWLPSRNIFCGRCRISVRTWMTFW